jgi:hypothetical protein
MRKAARKRASLMVETQSTRRLREARHRLSVLCERAIRPATIAGAGARLSAPMPADAPSRLRPTARRQRPAPSLEGDPQRRAPTGAASAQLGGGNIPNGQRPVHLLSAGKVQPTDSRQLTAGRAKRPPRYGCAYAPRYALCARGA